MRSLPVIALLFFLSAQMGISADNRDFPDASVIAVARSSIERFLEKIPPGFEARYGFRNRDEFKRALPGVPLRVYIPFPDSQDAKNGNRSDHPVATDEWRVPVLVDGEFRSLLTVTTVAGVLKAVDLGGAALAREFGEFDKKYSGSQRALFRVGRLKCDFILRKRPESSIDEGEYHPLPSARVLFNSDTASFCSRRELYGEINRRYREARNKDR
jgi:hypothetical protein